jgi:hypothetical protein
MSTANWNHRTNVQAYSAPETDDGPRFDHHGPMPYLPQPVSALSNGRASVKRAALAGRLAGAAVGAALFLGAPILATLTASPAFAEVDPNGDPDKDRLSNDFEIHITKTMIYDSDTDNDGLGDGDENLVHHTHPNSFDTDNDHFTDGQEVNMYRTNPLVADTDNDGFTEFEEYNAGTDMKDPNSRPGGGGNGGGGGPVEECPGGQPNDCDADGMLNEDETNGWNSTGHKTDPKKADTDGDGVNDGAEDDNGTNPTDPNDN